jgi:phosphatidylserine synthase
MRLIIKIGALALVVLFFFPLVSCGSLTGFDDGFNGIEIGTDMEEPLVFVLLVIPVVLAILAFTKVKSKSLGGLSVTGLLAVIGFMIWTHIEYEGILRFTVFLWTKLILYIVLIICCFADKEKQ